MKPCPAVLFIDLMGFNCAANGLTIPTPYIGGSTLIGIAAGAADVVCVWTLNAPSKSLDMILELRRVAVDLTEAFREGAAAAHVVVTVAVADSASAGVAVVVDVTVVLLVAEIEARAAVIEGGGRPEA